MAAALSVAQIMARSGLALRHVEPTIVESDWRITDRCPKCHGSIFTLRRGADYGRQEEHTPQCGKERTA